MGEVMNKDQFAGQIFFIFEDRSLKVPSLPWIEALFAQVHQFSDAQISKGLSKVMSITAEEWNKKYGFGGKPAIADWVDFFADKKSFTPEREAAVQADKIINHAEYYCGNDTLFDNPFTNATVKAYGGLGTVKWKLFDPFNKDKKPGDRDWIHGKLKRIWLDCHDGKKGDVTPFIGNSSVKTKVVYVGDKEKCLALVNNLKEIENDK
jgi:hypothetical protein